MKGNVIKRCCEGFEMFAKRVFALVYHFSFINLQKEEVK